MVLIMRMHGLTKRSTTMVTMMMMMKKSTEHSPCNQVPHPHHINPAPHPHHIMVVSIMK